MARTYETIYDTDNAFDWAQITNTYIDGVLTIENKLLDTGFSELTFYRDGYVSSFQVAIPQKTGTTGTAKARPMTRQGRLSANTSAMTTVAMCR